MDRSRSRSKSHSPHQKDENTRQRSQSGSYSSRSRSGQSPTAKNGDKSNSPTNDTDDSKQPKDRAEIEKMMLAKAHLIPDPPIVRRKQEKRRSPRSGRRSNRRHGRDRDRSGKHSRRRSRSRSYSSRSGASRSRSRSAGSGSAWSGYSETSRSRSRSRSNGRHRRHRRRNMPGVTGAGGGNPAGGGGGRHRHMRGMPPPEFSGGGIPGPMRGDRGDRRRGDRGFQQPPPHMGNNEMFGPPMRRDNRRGNNNFPPPRRGGGRDIDRMRGNAGGGNNGSGMGGNRMPPNENNNGPFPSPEKRPNNADDNAINGDVKPPMTFKEFMEQLPDNVLPAEAEKKFNDYLSKVAKSDDDLFFEAHKDEEWFQDRYDPIVIEKYIAERKAFARTTCPLFWEQMLADQIPEIHDNADDFSLIDPEKCTWEETLTKLKQLHKEESEEPEELDIPMTTTITSTSTITPQTAEAGNEPNADTPADGTTTAPSNAASLLSRRMNNKNVRFFENSVFIQGMPLHIKREQILKVFQNVAGFRKLILSDPIKNPRRVRYGWVEFENQMQCEQVCKNVKQGGLNEAPLTPQYYMTVLPKAKSKRKPKYAPPESMYPRRVARDIEQSLELANKFDAESEITENPITHKDTLECMTEIRRLNMLLAYLRYVHKCCYYCGRHYFNEEHMYARCANTHERKVPSDMTLAVSGVHQNSVWEMEVDHRVKDMVKDMRSTTQWLDRKKQKICEKKTKEITSGKFQCVICTKLFKDAVYVHKHINNKHQPHIATFVAAQRLKTMLKNYKSDKDRLTIRSFEEDRENERDFNDRRRDRRFRDRQFDDRPPFGPNRGGFRHNRQRRWDDMGGPPPPHMGMHSHPHPHQSGFGNAPPQMMQHARDDVRMDSRPSTAGSGTSQPSQEASQSNSVQQSPMAGGDSSQPGTPFNKVHPARQSMINSSSDGPPRPNGDMGPPFDRPPAPDRGFYPDQGMHNMPNRPPFDGHNNRFRNRGGGRGGNMRNRGFGGSGRGGFDRGSDAMAVDRRELMDRFDEPLPPRGGPRYPPDMGGADGRPLPIRFNEIASRTLRSYRDVEFPADDIEEEIDYGFGDADRGEGFGL